MPTLKYYDTTSSSWKYLLQNNGNYASPVYDELLSGTIDGTNKIFTTTRDFQSIMPFKNGVGMHVGDDFTVTGTNQITFVVAPTTGSKITASYWSTANYNITGSNSTVFKETPAGAVNGVNGTFTTSRGYLPGTLQVYVNGLAQSSLATETNPATGVFTIDAPTTGADVSVSYQFAGSVSGNADTVDGYHASQTPAANNIPVLDVNAKLPATIISNPYRFSVYRNAAWTPTAGTENTVPFDGAEYDRNNNFNLTNYRYTAPVTGLYHFNGTMSAAQTSGTTYISLWKNGVSYRRGGRDGTTNDSYCTISVDVELAAGDYVELRLYVGSGGVETGAAQNWFQGRLVAI